MMQTLRFSSAFLVCHYDEKSRSIVNVSFVENNSGKIEINCSLSTHKKSRFMNFRFQRVFSNTISSRSMLDGVIEYRYQLSREINQ